MTTKFDSTAYKFGDSVEITGTASGGYGEFPKNYRRVIRNDFVEGKTLKGRIIGIGRIMVGRVEKDFYDNEDYPMGVSGSYNVFFPTGMAWAWKVVIAMSRNDVLCLSDQIRPIDEEVEIPVAINRSWTQEEKDQMRDIMKDVPRDDKGQWIKTKQPVNA